MAEHPLTPLHADLQQRAVVDTNALPWVQSPEPTVERKLIEREGGDGTRATSLVRFAPGASFPEHVHHGGEEFLVLEGRFCDESGCFPAGSYVRNPPGSSHRPSAPDGCTILVKLHHMSADDQEPVVVDTHREPWQAGLVEGLEVMPLADVGGEHTALVRWAPGTRFQAHHHFGGEEIFVLEGTFADEFGQYPAGTWLRSPHWSRHAPYSETGCTIWVKTGHLPIPDSWYRPG
ncbi:cupin domain-containing protein [Guyparkeria sp. 1SP6A2]|nr:cupin domain-containing protein [Guyparkeria sp. 1SP6A2]